MLKRNFHTHTALCKHATGMPEDYCVEARKQGVSTIAFTDHTPFRDGRWHNVRMNYDQLPTYVQAVRKARENNPDLEILLGLECEHDPDNISWFQDEFLGKYGMDLLIMGMHHYWFDGKWAGSYDQMKGLAPLRAYTEFMIKGMETGLYAFVAHPDLFGVFRRGWDADTEAASRDIAQAAQACNIPLEINAYGLRKAPIEDHGELRPMYPWEPFWRVLADYQVPVLVNSDAHHPEDIWGRVDDGIAMAERYGLKVVNSTFHVNRLG